MQIRSESNKALHAHLENVVFEGNVCGQDGGALNVRGSKATATVKNCVFKDNEAVDGGAAIRLNAGGNAVLDGCTVKDNKAGSGGGSAIHTGGKNWPISITSIWHSLLLYCRILCLSPARPIPTPFPPTWHATRTSF